MDRIQGIRDLYVLLLKGDLAILAGFATLLSVLEFSGSDLVDTASEMRLPALMILFAATLTLLALWAISLDTATGAKEREYYWHGVSSSIILAFQILAFGFTASYADTLLERRSAYLHQRDAEKKISDLVGTWYENHGYLPDSGDILYVGNGSERIAQILSGTSADTFAYEKKSDTYYEIRMPGADNTLGNSDDLLIGRRYGIEGANLYALSDSTQIKIRQAVVDWYRQYGRLPSETSELYKGEVGRKIRDILSTARIDTFGYDKTGQESYEIIMPGGDRRLGTQDDSVIPVEIVEYVREQ